MNLYFNRLVRFLSMTTCLQLVVAEKHGKLPPKTHPLDDNSSAPLSPPGKIINGTPAPINTYLWFTSLVVSSSEDIFCGGTLIAPDIVLTAGHCIDFIDSSNINFYDVIVGNYEYASGNGGQVYEKIPMEEVLVHPGWVGDITSDAVDFGLIKLSQPCTITTPIGIDADAISSDYDTSKDLKLLGFGVTEDGFVSTYLREATLGYLPENQCGLWTGFAEDDNMICLDTETQSSCNGDSGGPAYDVENGIVVGATSWGAQGCPINQNYPVVYARIGTHYDWIKTNACDLSEVPSPLCDDAPPSECMDPELKFRMKRPNGKYAWKRCPWVAKKKKKRCLPKVTRSCPATCGTCDVCKDSYYSFKVMINGVLTKKSCAWVQENPGIGCALAGEACRRTCMLCTP